MALKTYKDFKGRSRTNMVPRVAKRINNIEKKTKDNQSVMTSTQMGGTIDGKKRSRANKSITSQKVMNYAEIKKWNQRYALEGKSVYQLDAEFTSLNQIQVQEMQAKIKKLQKTVHTNEKKVE